MNTTNLPSGAGRDADVGLVWVEVLTGTTGTFKGQVQGTIRVDCIADATITIGGVLAMTIRAGQVERLNLGVGESGDNKVPVTVVIAGGNCNVQLAKMIDAQARRSR